MTPFLLMSYPPFINFFLSYDNLQDSFITFFFGGGGVVLFIQSFDTLKWADKDSI